MSDNRKYYYLKLKENYFDDDSILHRMCHNAYRYRAGDSRFFRFQTSRLFIPAEAGDAAAVLIGSQQHIG